MPNNNKPNILVIFGDDIGIPQISAYTRGLMGYQTPNIDRIANEGALFTDAYGQQSCTAGRASFILGQEPFRTGPMMVRWPGVVKLGTQYNDIISLIDWFPTFCAAAGIPDIKEKMKAGFNTGKRTFKVHLDGYNFMP